MCATDSCATGPCAAEAADILRQAPDRVTDDQRPVWHVPLDVFSRLFAPAYYGPTWAGVLDAMKADPFDWETVEALRPHAAGGFDSPVVVDVDDEGSRVADGMHRVTAAMLQRVPTIAITDRHEGGDPDAIEVAFTVIPPASWTGDSLGFAASALRSFPLGDTWVTSDTFSARYELLAGTWYCPAELRDRLLMELQQRAWTCDAQLAVRSVKIVPGGSDG